MGVGGACNGFLSCKADSASKEPFGLLSGGAALAWHGARGEKSLKTSASETGRASAQHWPHPECSQRMQLYEWPPL